MKQLNPENGPVIVMGGAGFLGSHVADILTDRGYQVRVFDKNGSPYLKEGQEMIIGDILDLKAMKNAIDGCQAVYFFAGLADIDEARNNPLDTCRLNVMGCVNALEASRASKVSRFVFASTVYVYSNSGSFYRASKQSAEMFIEAYHENYGLDFTILRYGSLYGRRADHRNGIYRLLFDAMTKKKISYQGTGEELREYIHVLDAAELSADILKPEFANKHIILTGNEKIKKTDLIVMIKEMLNNNIEVEFSGDFEDVHYFMTPYAFNPKMAKKLVGTHCTDMGQGLLDCLQEIYEKTHGDVKKVGNWIVNKTSGPDSEDNSTI
ncbi:MAG: NAD(P)-dependent oxidoreductase [Nitrospirota bacterium]|nr:NAD(P)-dependent oxidoreductase [Nitrospirota bacterium]